MKTNTIIQGFPGSGKTRAVLTLLPEYIDEKGKTCKGAGKTVLYTAMEPGFEHVLRTEQHGCAQGLHFHYHYPKGLDFKTIRTYVDLMATSSLKDVVEMSDPQKRKYTGFAELFGVLAEWTCDKCGEVFGNVTEDLSDQHALVLDSLSPLSVHITQAVCGGKPIPSKPEYFAMFGLALSFLRLLYQATKCSFILTAHMDKELDPVTGDLVLTLDTIGQRLVKQIVKMPDELVTAYEDSGKYYWSNNPGRTGHTVMKRRALPSDDQLAPDFSQFLK